MTDRDPYCYAGTSVLKNLGGHKSKKKLKEFELLLFTYNALLLEAEPLTGPFTVNRLQETHKRLFKGVYVWAGQLRENTGWIGKDRGLGYGGVRYCDSRFIDRELHKALSALAAENYLKDLPPDQFPERAAYYYGEIDAIHPFREGNSRTLRWFFADMALDAGYKVEWEKMGYDENARNRLYLARDTAVLRADHAELTKIFRTITVPITETP